MNEKWDDPGKEFQPGEELDGQKKESLFISIVLFRILPVLMVVLSVSSLLYGWIRIADDLKDDLNRIQKYVGIGSNIMNKYLGTDELAGIDVGEIEKLITVFSDGLLTPEEIFVKGDTVQNAASSIRTICTKFNLKSDTADALDTLSDSIQLFRYLYIAVFVTAAVTVLLILFRKKILGNWYFTITMAFMAGWCWRLVRTISENGSGEPTIQSTIVPVIALLLSLPLIPYGKKDR